MPQQPPVRPARSEGEFAELFARRARTPLRGFLPGRRVWNAVGGSAVTVLVIVGTTAVVSRIDFGSDPQKVTTAAEKTVPAKEKATTDRGKPAATASSDSPSGENADKEPDVVYLPGSGGSGGSGGGTSGGGSGSGQSGTTGDRSTSGDEQQDSSSQSSGSTQPASTGFLWSDGSLDSADDNGYWDQSIVTVKSTKTLSSLKVVVKIIQTGGVASTGTWTSLGDKVTVASGATSSELDYVVTLKSGVTLGPGTYVFKFQYNHDQGRRDAGGDRYNVTATTTSSDSEYSKGGF
ncbi:hypothetical protein [Streptomyces sp. NL15-2K]|uniref:hypothetical protein n=1 Tax=Streptomyces sp. NL15-2K TaxID=376149 RepID=UPI000F57F5D1|nr:MULTISPECIES: hypothetical protein [Actinomycetes]WKX06600.1 hypothetical protein Q4V64_03460 [Kutzneria buriramensis]GCB43616.1 hypothetical protein SNL152K_901 [Streptomyces sp. NL15-2K]